MTKKVGIIGSGDVAQTLAGGFLNHGHQVMIGTRDPSKIQKILVDWKINLRIENIGSFKDAAEFGEIVVLALKGSAVEEVARDIKHQLKGKTVIDVTNPLIDLPPEDGLIKFFTAPDESLMERLQKIVPHAKFVKAFNSVGSSVMVNPYYDGIVPTMFICGDEEGKNEAIPIIEQFGYEVCDLGSVKSSRVIEQLCILWCIPGFLRNEWNHAFKLLRK